MHVVAMMISTCGERTFLTSPLPLGGIRGFRSASNLGCYVTKFATHTALKSIAFKKLIF